MAAPTPKTLWVWPSGMFPRRVIYYLKAKGVTQLDLDNLGLKLIPVILNKEKMSLDSVEGYEQRPQGYSLPVLRIGDADSPTYITQSSSILEYLEDMIPEPCLRGKDPITTAKDRDIVHAVNECLAYISIYVVHGKEESLAFSGLTKEQQSPVAAAAALEFAKRCLGRIQSWVERDYNQCLLGGPSPTLADFTLASARAYVEEMYGTSLFDGFEVLTRWWSMYQASEWFITRAEIGEIEKEGFGELLK